MKRMYALLSATMVAAAIALPSRASSLAPKMAAPQDTLILKLKNEARLLVVVKDVKDLKNLKNEKIDSLMLLLDKYASQIEAAGKNGEEVTVTIEKGQANASEDVSITIAQNNPGGTEVVIKEKNRIRITDKVGIDIDKEEDGNSTRVKVNVGDSSADEDEDKDKDKDKEKSRNPKKDFVFQIDLGVSNWMNKEALAGSSVQDIDLKPLGSRYISLNSKWHYRIGGVESPLRLISGFNFDFHNYMFDDNIMIVRNEATTDFVKADPINLEKSKLATSSINIPLEIGLDFKNSKGESNFQIGGGGFVGYMFSSHSKVKYSQNGDNFKRKIKDDYNLNDLLYGVSGFISIRDFEFFGKYNLNEVFEDNKGPKANTLTFGVRIEI
ncbi:outer membrane beta-barrel protein [Rufibacter psychrotolerans]|uniref:outer membrane beta-barrel protein n=1 Tax=Rufibacter psychrotolerans TaxID=2812556 RepID=UPI0019678091|nr:outer membrane beta-barrel protein [Rufibacter sp. SYSU D00308]